MLMDGRLALPPDWKDQQLLLSALTPCLMFGGRRLNGEIGARIGEGARVTSPRREIRRIGPKQFHTIVLRCPHGPIRSLSGPSRLREAAHTCEFRRVLQRGP